MRSSNRTASIVVAVLSLISLGTPTRLAAQELVLQPGLGKFFETLYARVVGGKLDLHPMYEAVGITVSDRTCDPTVGTGSPRACATANCPAASSLGIAIACLYDQHEGVDGSDLVVKPPYPVKRLGDYDPEWNSYQFKTLETKLGGRLPPFGLIRTLTIAGQERSGFFDFVRMEDTSDGNVAVDRWHAAAKGGVGVAPACGGVTCFSVHRVVPAPDSPWSTLREALVECVEHKVKNSEGPPEYCTPIYLRGSGGTFVSAITSFRNESMRVIRGLISANVFFDSGTSKPNFQTVADLVEKALAAEPLSLETSRDPDAIVGVSVMRPSRIINNWQEMATVRAVMTEVPLAVSEPGGTARNLVGIRVGLATTLYLNNRNTADESEWRMPTASQEASFDAAIVSTIRAEAARECATATSQVRDSVTIIACAAGRW